MRVAIDSPAFIYAFEDDGELGDLARALFLQIETGQYGAIASTLCLTEVIAKPASLSEEVAFETQMFLESIENLDYLPVDMEVAIRAGRLRAEFGSKLRTADAIHLATAIYHQADVLITNDYYLAGLTVAGLKIKKLGEPLA